MTNAVIISIFISLSLSCSSQTSSDLIIGEWTCYHKELEDGNTGEDYTLDGKPYSCDELTIRLSEDNVGWESMGDSEFRYQLNDSILTLGNRRYVVEKLNSEKLILRDLKSETSLISQGFRQKFRRIE